MVNIFNGYISSVKGIYLDFMSFNQMFFHKLFLNLDEKAPMYDTNYEAKSTSPIILTLVFIN